MIAILFKANTNQIFIWKHKRTQIAKVTFNRKTKAGSIAIPDTRAYRFVETKTYGTGIKTDI
jgi:hypothetical protein